MIIRLKGRIINCRRTKKKVSKLSLSATGGLAAKASIAPHADIENIIAIIHLSIVHHHLPNKLPSVLENVFVIFIIPLTY
tara:strand:+ start:4725 stop:4964 length:240 start_codon:yes stop_codon:yes gene_type:complete